MRKRSISISQTFTYRYENEIHESFAVLYLDGDYFRYQVTIGNERLTITPSVFPGFGDSIVWTQSLRLGEIAKPPDLIQALGEGIEALG
jgi:hypothetical protein